MRTRRGRLLGTGERLVRAGAKGFTVRVVMNARGHRLLRRGKLRRAVVRARGVDSVGRVDTTRRKVRF